MLYLLQRLDSIASARGNVVEDRKVESTIDAVGCTKPSRDWAEVDRLGHPLEPELIVFVVQERDGPVYPLRVLPIPTIRHMQVDPRVSPWLLGIVVEQASAMTTREDTVFAHVQACTRTSPSSISPTQRLYSISDSLLRIPNLVRAPFFFLFRALSPHSFC